MNIQPKSIIEVAKQTQIAKNIDPKTAINGGKLSYTFATDAFKASAENVAEKASKTGIFGKAANIAKNAGKKVINGVIGAGKAVINGAKNLLGKTPVGKAVKAVKTAVGKAASFVVNSKPVQFVKGLASKLPGIAKKAV